MSHEIQLIPDEGSGQSGQIMAHAPAPALPRVELYRRWHRILRGRYKIVMPLVVIGAIAGAIWGYHWTRPRYRADAMVQIRSSMPTILRPTEDNGLISLYEQYIQSQALLISGQQVTNLAMQKAMMTPAWRRVDRQILPATSEDFGQNLLVEHTPNTEYISVSYIDPVPDIAAAGANAVVDSYAATYNADEDQEKETKRRALLDEETNLNIKIQYAQEKVDTVLQKYHAPSLDPLYDICLQKVANYESRLSDANAALAMVDTKMSAEEAASKLTSNEIAMLDETMREKLALQSSVELEYTQTRSRTGDGNPAVKQLTETLKAVHQQVEDYARDFRALQVKLANAGGSQHGTLPLLVQNVGLLREQQGHLETMVKAARDELSAIGGDRLTIQRASDEIAGYQKRLTELVDRRKSLEMESHAGNRLRVSSAGIPSVPYKDRRKFCAVVGGLGGGLLPLAAFIIVGLVKPRVRYCDDAEGVVGMPPLLGILPALPKDLIDPEQAAVAAHCIHQIRIMLQLASPPGTSTTYMITGAGSGDGKTSLTMALGLSFAASGSRTLVVDADMVGQRLTRRFQAGECPGLIEALDDDNSEFWNSVSPSTGGPGLLEALAGESLETCISQTATPGLWILPVGTADPSHATGLSRAGIGRLLASLRPMFDAIIIDTGPILGSLEASVIAAEANQVIMAVARGQDQTLVQRALRQLHAIGANTVGLVFNRAQQRDFQRSVASASIRSLNAPTHHPHAVIDASEQSSRFGPLARSVASFMPAKAGKAADEHNGNDHGRAS